VNAEARAWRTVLLFALLPAVVAGVVVGVAVDAIVGVIVGVVLAGGLGAWARLGGDRRVRSLIDGREADPRREARLCNLVEGLSISAGVRQPQLRVIDSPGLNVLAAGTSPARGVIAATTGLLAELNRVELEAVLAEQLVRLRHGETLPGTVLAATFGIGRSRAITSDMDALADQGAVALTRYPPALAAALEKMDAKGTQVGGIPEVLSPLWMADPTGATPLGRGRLPLRERIEALREL
jgi:heat shock protein HtpX